MTPKLRAFLIAIGVAAIASLVVAAPGLVTPRWPHYLVWVILCLVAETMTTEAPDGHGTWSLSSSAALASVVLWGPLPAIWIAAVSTLLSELLVLKKPWIRASFNAGQTTLTIAAAGAAYTLLAQATRAIAGPLSGHGGWLTGLLLAPALAALMVVYHVVNRALVGIPVAWTTDRPYWKALREDWFYVERLLNDAAAYLLAPLMVVAFHAISYLGVALFYAPLYMVYLSDRRQIELRKAYEDLRAAQERLIESELAVQVAELSRSFGHDLNNVMTPIVSRAQMLLRDAQQGVWDNVAKYANIILEQTQVAGEMSRSLRDARLTEPNLAAVQLNQLVQQAVEAVRNQPRLAGVEWTVQLAPELPEVMADAVQMHRVLGNLFVNAADAMNEATGLAEKRIRVESQLDPGRRKVRVVVTDTGPGIPADVLPRVFRPRFTTKKTGHGFGLSGSKQIVLKHGGDLSAESPPGSGAVFTLELPLPPITTDAAA